MKNLDLYEKPMLIIEYLDSETWEGVPLKNTGEVCDGAYTLLDLMGLDDYFSALETLIEGADKANTFETSINGHVMKAYIDNSINY
jgi:hypothetical protein